jgi:nucleoid DNA-binding protein/LysM repeat protein
MSEKITLQELVDLIAEQTGETKQFTQDFIHELPDVIQQGLREDGQVNLKGLGIFRLKWVKARTGRNPQTGEEIRIPGRNRIVFKPDKELREYVNRKYAHLKPKILKQKQAEILDWDENNNSQPKKRKAVWWAAAALLFLLFAAWLLTKPDNTKVAQHSSITAPEKQDTRINPEEKETYIEHENTAISHKDTTKAVQQTPKSSNDHTVEPGENLWSLAAENYNNGFYWPNVYRVNYEQIPNPDEIYPGLIIRIPAFQGSPTNLTRRDSADIAQGYYLTYLAYKNLSRPYADNYLRVSKKFNALNDLFEGHHKERVLAQIEKGQ